jgi:hypothetical protein
MNATHQIQSDVERKMAERRIASVAISMQVSGHDADPSESSRPYVRIVDGVNCGGFVRRAIFHPLPEFVNYSCEVTR